jgi:hypothetical protein
MKSKLQSFLMTPVLLAIGERVARATTIIWINTAGGDWSVANNWNPHSVPGSSDDAYITNNGTYGVAGGGGGKSFRRGVGGVERCSAC